MTITILARPTILPRSSATEPVVYVPAVGEDPTPGIRAVLEHPGPTGIVAVDVETTGLEWDARLRTIQFGSPTHAVVLDAESDPLHFEAAREVLADQNRRFTAHNAAFDALVLDRNDLVDGVELLGRTMDTSILLALLEPPARLEGHGMDVKRDLKSLAADYLGDAYSPDAKKALQASWRKNKWTVSGPFETRGWAQCDIHTEEFQRYAAADVIDGARLVETLLPLAMTAVDETVINREHRILALCAGMQRQGYLVNRQAARETIEAEDVRVAALDVELKRLGIESVTKNREVAEILEAETGVALPLSDNGAKKVDKLTLSNLGGSTIAPLILERRAVEKGTSTYLRNWLAMSEADGKLHPTINTLKAATGRFSMDNPSMQNVPADLRRFIIPPPGFVLVTADYSSVEMRVGAGCSGETTLIADFRAGVDPYRLVAHAAYHPNDPDDSNVTKQERNRAKAILLGRMYGRGVASLARQEGMDEEEAKRIMSLIDHRYPRLAVFGKSLERAVKFGRTRIPLPSGRAVVVDPTYARKAMNYVVQGIGRELMVDAGLRLQESGFAEYLWMSIHDEWIVCVPADQAEEAAARMVAVMNTEFEGVPVVAEATILGDHWGK